MVYRDKVWLEYPAKDQYINFTDCRTLGELHQMLKDELELPSFYGENLDALWDSITGLMYVPANVTIKKGGAKELAGYIDKIIEIFNRAVDEYGDITVEVLESEE